MKEIKIFIIGFLTCACLFLIMGQSRNMGPQIDKHIGIYQGFADDENRYLVDTRTGETFKRKCEIPGYGCQWEYFVSSKH